MNDPRPVHMELWPRQARGRRATFHVAFQNRSATPVAVALQADDPAGALHLRVEPAGHVVMAPGGTSLVTVYVEPRVRRLVGQPCSYAITLRGVYLGRAEDAAPALLEQAVFIHDPLPAVLPRGVRRRPARSAISPHAEGAARANEPDVAPAFEAVPPSARCDATAPLGAGAPEATLAGSVSHDGGMSDVPDADRCRSVETGSPPQVVDLTPQRDEAAAAPRPAHEVGATPTLPDELVAMPTRPDAVAATLDVSEQPVAPAAPSAELAAAPALQEREAGTSVHPRVSRPWVPACAHAGKPAACAEVVYGQAAVAPGPAPQMAYALLGLRPSDGIAFPRLPLNLALVLDHSSSMLRGGKVERLKDTVRQIIDLLDSDDFLAIVTFGDCTDLLLPAQRVGDGAAAQGAIEAMRCRGGTEIARGLGVGLAELGRHAARALSHLILLTDGQTYGDEMLCLERAEEAARLGVGISAYGLGADWNSALLDGIAGATGGLSDYIATPEGMAEAFGARVRSLQATTLCNVRLRVAAAAGCSVRRLTLVSPLLRPLEPDGAQQGAAAISLALGDLSRTDEYRVLVELAVGPRARAAGTMPLAELALCYDVPGLQREGEVLRIPLALPVTAEHDSRCPVDPRIVEALRHTTAHRLQERAWAEGRSGDLPKGADLLRRAAEHLEVAGHRELAQVAVAEAARVEAGDSASDENVKRLIYGTRKLPAAHAD